MKTRYGITVSMYDSLLKAQKKRCALCGKPLPLTRPKAIHLDHDHETGEVRGILHARCNMMLGLVRDNPDTLLKAIQYLDRPPALVVLKGGRSRG